MVATKLDMDGLMLFAPAVSSTYLNNPDENWVCFMATTFSISRHRVQEGLARIAVRETCGILENHDGHIGAFIQLLMIRYREFGIFRRKPRVDSRRARHDGITAILLGVEGDLDGLFCGGRTDTRHKRHPALCLSPDDFYST